MDSIGHLISETQVLTDLIMMVIVIMKMMMVMMMMMFMILAMMVMLMMMMMMSSAMIPTGPTTVKQCSSSQVCRGLCTAQRRQQRLCFSDAAQPRCGVLL